MPATSLSGGDARGPSNSLYQITWLLIRNGDDSRDEEKSGNRANKLIKKEPIQQPGH